MEFRLWIGVWIFLFLFIIVAFNLSFLVKYITRFTEDCFATLVAIVFIFDAVKSVLKLKNLKLKSINENLISSNNSNEESLSLNEISLVDERQDATFYFSFILFITSFGFCMILKSFKKSLIYQLKYCFCWFLNFGKLSSKSKHCISQGKKLYKRFFCPDCNCHYFIL